MRRVRGALGVERLGLLGCFPRNKVRPYSDVDILAEFAPGEKNFDRLMGVAFVLDDLLRRRVREFALGRGGSPRGLDRPVSQRLKSIEIHEA